MILTPKQKWVVDRLKRNGYKADFHNYSDDEMLVYKSISINPGFDWVNTVIFYISNKKGCRAEFRPVEHEALHLVHHFSWPTMKNWGEIEEFERFCKKFSWYDTLNPKA